MTAYLAGFTLGLSLILAIGAQNAFVLKQGLKQQYVFLVCGICAVSDALLITIGVSGFGIILQQYPAIEDFARFGGALFLFFYAFKSFYAAFTKTHVLNPAEIAPDSVVKITLTCLAFTWLNPHVYLDTVVLLGSISTQFVGSKIEFTMGAVSASFVFFFSLGYGARVLIPIFQKPLSWKILDAFVGFLMFSLAISLL